MTPVKVVPSDTTRCSVIRELQRDMFQVFYKGVGNISICDRHTIVTGCSNTKEVNCAKQTMVLSPNMSSEQNKESMGV